MTIKKESIRSQADVAKNEAALATLMTEYFITQSESLVNQIKTEFSKFEELPQWSEAEVDDFVEALNFDINDEKSFIDSVKDLLVSMGGASVSMGVQAIESAQNKAVAPKTPKVIPQASQVVPEAEIEDDLLEELDEVFEPVKVRAKAQKAVVKYAQDRSGSLIGKKIVNGNIVNNPKAEWNITETTRKNLRDMIKKAMADGDSNDVLAENIKKHFTFSKERSLLIARTETNMADNDATFNTFKNAGFKKKRWLTASDDKVSPECVANGLQEAIEMDDLFQSGVICPPGHPNCRCTLLAVFEKS